MTECAMFPTPAMAKPYGHVAPSELLARADALAEAWMWRCADIPHDTSKQSRMDSEADGQMALESLPHSGPIDFWGHQAVMGICGGFRREPPAYARLSAHHAFRAVPALREP